MVKSLGCFLLLFECYEFLNVGADLENNFHWDLFLSIRIPGDIYKILGILPLNFLLKMVKTLLPDLV